MVSLSDKGDQVREIIRIWENNLATVDRRLKLLDKLERQRKVKVEASPFVKFHSDFVGQLLMSESFGMSQARASINWMVTGDFGLFTPEETLDAVYPNVLLTCINPLHTRAVNFYQADLLADELSHYEAWISEAEPEDELVYAPHAIDSPFQVIRCSDPLTSNVILALCRIGIQMRLFQRITEPPRMSA